eukprot:3668641-Amphidinium_carterae.1
MARARLQPHLPDINFSTNRWLVLKLQKWVGWKLAEAMTGVIMVTVPALLIWLLCLAGIGWHVPQWTMAR